MQTMEQLKGLKLEGLALTVGANGGKINLIENKNRTGGILYAGQLRLAELIDLATDGGSINHENNDVFNPRKRINLEIKGIKISGVATKDDNITINGQTLFIGLKD